MATEAGMLKPLLDADKIEGFAKDFNKYIAKDLVNQTYNERLAQHAGTGVATALSSRRKAIDAAFTNMFPDGKKRQLAMDGADELNLWILDRTALIGNPKLKNANRFIPRAGPYLFTGLTEGQKETLTQVSWNDLDAQASSSDDLPDPWFRAMQSLDLTRGSRTQELLAAVSNDEKMREAQGPRYNPQTDRKASEGKEAKAQEQVLDDTKMASRPNIAPSKRVTGVVSPQLQVQQPQQPAITRSDDDIRNVMRQEPMNTTGDSGDLDLRGHYGGLADYFMPNDSQKKRNAEAKTLKALASTSHPSVVFARKYFQEYDQTDPIERQALPMQRELAQRRVTLDMVVSKKTNPREYELIKVLLERDALEADLALDPGDDELIEAMESVLERWRQIKLV